MEEDMKKWLFLSIFIVFFATTTTTTYSLGKDDVEEQATDEDGNLLWERDEDGFYKVDDDGKRIPVMVTRSWSLSDSISDDIYEENTGKEPTKNIEGFSD